MWPCADRRLTQEVHGSSSICKPSCGHVSIELASVRWMVRFGEGHEVVVVSRIGEGVSEDEERRSGGDENTFVDSACHAGSAMSLVTLALHPSMVALHLSLGQYRQTWIAITKSLTKFPLSVGLTTRGGDSNDPDRPNFLILVIPVMGLPRG